MGGDFFAAAAARYIRDCPSRSGNLQDYGARFPEFLERMPEAASLAYLPDVARLEWARQESYLAADAAPPAPEVFAGIPEHGQCKLSLHPGVRLVASRHPIWDIWMFCQETTSEHLKLSRAGQTVLIWRTAQQLTMQPLASGQRELVALLLAGETLAVAHTRALAANPGFDIAACLHWLLQNNFVTGYSIH